MAYEPRPLGPIVDKTYPSEVAAQRPLLATRIHCPADLKRADEEGEEERKRMLAESQEREPSIRGSLIDDRCAEFNKALRSGLGVGGQDLTRKRDE